MKEDPEYWFPAKTLGWGWGLPLRWQGWVAYGIATALLVAGPFVLPPDEEFVLFHVYTACVVIALLIVCFIKGEPPSWRWGKWTWRLTMRSSRPYFAPPTTWQEKLAMVLAPLRRAA